MPIDRVSFNSSQLLIRENLLRVQQQYRDAQEPATTGLRVNHLFDDTQNMSRIFSLRNSVTIGEQYQKNATTARLRLEYTDARLAQTTDVLERIREIALKANDPTLSTSLRSQIADQIDSLKDELLSHANAQYNNKYIFAGTASDTLPFSGTPTTFQGNSTSLPIQIASSLAIPVTLDGNEVFSGTIATAAGTDLATTLKDSNSVSLGLESGNVITLAGTVGATAFSTTLTVTPTTTLANIASSLQTILRASGNNTEIAAVQGNGSIRVTSGAAAITGLTLSVSGNTIFNDAFTYTTPIAGGGATGSSDTLQTGTGEDIFDVVDDLKDAINSGDASDIATHLERLDASLAQVNLARALAGTRIQQIQNNEAAIQEDRVRILEDLSNLQDADITDAFSNLASKEVVLKMVFATSSKFLETLSSINLR